MKILFLTPWYPSDKDAMSGLFVQKHVEAVRAQGVDVRVLFSLSWREMWQAWKALQREGWMPDVVQLNVIQKQGLLALWLKRRYKIPYVIIEHWSGYLPENGAFGRMAKWKQDLYRLIAREAEVVMTVSDRHAKAMRACGMEAKRWERVNNVVDDFFFENQRIPNNPNNPNTQKNLLHISCFDERAKNVKGLLRAAKELSKKRQDWKLVLVGTGVDYDDVREYAERLDIPEGLLEWTGELSPHEVAAAFDKADVFVLTSNYENAPVVISESLAKGVPVVATQVGGIPEMVDATCGILVAPKQDAELIEALETMLDHSQEYNRDVIRLCGESYSFAKIGRQLKDLYEQVQTR